MTRRTSAREARGQPSKKSTEVAEGLVSAITLEIRKQMSWVGVGEQEDFQGEVEEEPPASQEQKNMAHRLHVTWAIFQ